MQPALTDLLQRASDLTTEVAGLGADRLLPVVEQLRTLFPGYGLRRGSVVGVTGELSGTTSLLIALLSAASRSGSWCAVAGLPTLGFVAAAEAGLVLERVAVVPNPGPDWPGVVAALIDGFDVVVIAVAGVAAGHVAAQVCAQMAARARRRGSVLVPFGSGWDGAEVTLSLLDSAWQSVGEGAGRQVTIATRGRGASALGRRAKVWLPAPEGVGSHTAHDYFGPPVEPALPAPPHLRAVR
jgi:hypothetical protein